MDYQYWSIRISERKNTKSKIAGALNWLENEIKMKENYLNSLDYGIREVIPMTKRANDLTYRPDNTYPLSPPSR